jgi:hypothetical protein
MLHVTLSLAISSAIGLCLLDKMVDVVLRSCIYLLFETSFPLLKYSSSPYYQSLESYL